MKTIKYVNSKITGGHYAFQSDRKSNKPFENNMGECKSIELFESDIVADIGAYVGEYSLWCSRQNVKEIYSYEPTPDTFELLKRNATDKMKLMNYAVIGDDRETIDLYISKGIGVTNSTAKSRSKSHKITVPAIQYEKAVENATVVKMDVEGAEYSYNIIQPNIRAIILEFHPLEKQDWIGKAMEIMRKLDRAGFRTIVEPTFDSGWSLTGSFLR